jgi:hypothetical protein
VKGIHYYISGANIVNYQNNDNNRKLSDGSFFLLWLLFCIVQLEEEGFTLLKKIRIILGIVVIALALYGLITKNFVAQPIMMLSLSAFILAGGLDELKQGIKRRGYISIFLAIFVLAIAIKTFLA